MSCMVMRSPSMPTTSVRCVTRREPSLNRATCANRSTAELLGGVLDCDNALVLGNVGGEHVEQRRLAGARTAADQNVQPRLYASLQQLQHALGHGHLTDQVLTLELVPAKTADGEQRAVHGHRRNSGVDARSVGQTRVHQWR